MSGDPQTKKGQAGNREDLVLTPGGRRPKSKVHKVEPGQQVEVQEGRLKVIDSATGEVVADLGVVDQTGSKTQRSGGSPMKRATRPNSAD